MSIPFPGSPLANAGVDELKVTFSLPRGTAWATGTGVRETLDEYVTALGRTGGPLSQVLIETQYFQDPRIARELFRRWSTAGTARKLPFAHIIIPYTPDTHWADISIPLIREAEFNKVVTAEFQNIRWLELRTMRFLLEQDSNGRWVPRYEVGDPAAQVTIQGAGQNEPTALKPDSMVEITDAYELPNGPQVARLSRRVDNIMTESQIMGYTLAADDAPAPAGATPMERQRAYLRANGIYVHSKAAVFLNDEDSVPDWATVGSANINRRSLDDAGVQDSEANIWWTHETRVAEYFRSLVAEHLNESDPAQADGMRMAEDGLEALNRIRSGQTPGCHLVRLDVADRLAHLV